MALRKANFLNLLQKEGDTQKGGSSLRKGGVPTLKETIKFLPAVLKPSLHSINYWEVNIVREFELWIQENNAVISYKLPIMQYYIKWIFYTFLFNIKNYLPEVINIQRCEAELNIILLRVNNFDIKQKRHGIFVLLYATNTKQDLGR